MANIKSKEKSPTIEHLDFRCNKIESILEKHTEMLESLKKMMEKLLEKENKSRESDEATEATKTKDCVTGRDGKEELGIEQSSFLRQKEEEKNPLEEKHTQDCRNFPTVIIAKPEIPLTPQKQKNIDVNLSKSSELPVERITPKHNEPLKQPESRKVVTPLDLKTAFSKSPAKTTRPISKKELLTPVNPKCPSKSPQSSRGKEQIELSKTSLSKSSMLNSKTPHKTPIKDQKSSTISKLLLTQKTPIKETKIKISFSLFEKFSGNCYDIIAEYLGESIPRFILCSKPILKQYAIYKLEECTIQIQLLQEQHDQLKEELKILNRPRKFILSAGLRKQYAQLRPGDWDWLNRTNLETLSLKDYLVLKLYLAFMNKDAAYFRKELFLTFTKQMLSTNKLCISKVMNPESSFVFHESNILKIKELLKTLQSGIGELAKASENVVLEVFTNILVEALCHSHIIPSNQETEFQQLRKELHYSVEKQLQLNK